MPALSIARVLTLTVSALVLLAGSCEAATIPNSAHISKNNNSQLTTAMTLGGKPIEDLGLTWKEADHTFTRVAQGGKSAPPLSHLLGSVTPAGTHLMDSYVRTDTEAFQPQCTWPKGSTDDLDVCIEVLREAPDHVWGVRVPADICTVGGGNLTVRGSAWVGAPGGAHATSLEIAEALERIRDDCSSCGGGSCFVGGARAVGDHGKFIIRVSGAKRRTDDRSVDGILASRDAGTDNNSKNLRRAADADTDWKDKCTWPRGPMTSIDECMERMKSDPDRVFKTDGWVEICRIDGSRERHMLAVIGYVKGGFTEGEATAREVWATLRWARLYCTSCHAPRDDCYVGGWWLTGHKKNMIVQITGSARDKDSKPRDPRSLLPGRGGDGIPPLVPLVEPPSNTTTTAAAGGDDDAPSTLGSSVVYKYGHPGSDTRFLFGPDRQPLRAFNLSWDDVQQGDSGLTPASRAAYGTMLSLIDSSSSSKDKDEDPKPECRAGQAPTNGTFAQACLDFLWANRANTWDVGRRAEVDICAVQVQTVRGEEVWRDAFRLYATTCGCREEVRIGAGAAAAGLERLLGECSRCGDDGRCRLDATLTYPGDLRFKMHVESYGERVEG